MMPPEESIKLARKYKIKTPKYLVAKRQKDALDFAEKVGYPVVIKTISPNISHKTEAGGVLTDLYRKDLKNAFNKIMKKSEGSVLLQKQVEGIETIIGGIEDSQFGPCVSFGTGGIFVEILDDISFRVCPVSKKAAKDMIKESKIYRILKGYRGKKYDIEGLCETIKKVSNLMLKEGIKEMDINPVMCSRKNTWAVDIRVN